MTEQIAIIDLIHDESKRPQLLKDYNDGVQHIVKGLDELEAVGYVEYTMEDGKMKSFKLLDFC